VRFASGEVTKNGLPWQSAFDALGIRSRPSGKPALPLKEQRRLLRHLRRRFEIHRFQMPPQVSELVDRERGGSPPFFCGNNRSVTRDRQDIILDIAARPHYTRGATARNA